MQNKETQFGDKYLHILHVYKSMYINHTFFSKFIFVFNFEDQNIAKYTHAININSATFDEIVL